MSGGVSVLWWLATPVANGNLSEFGNKSVIRSSYVTGLQYTIYLKFFASGNFAKMPEYVLYFHWVLFSLFQGLSMKRYCRVYFSLCLFLAILERSRTRWKLHVYKPTRKFPDIWYINVWSLEGVTVYGHAPERHVTFGRGMGDPRTDYRTFWFQTFPDIPAREAYMKVAPQSE